jgi:hypothetical protein
MNKKVTIFLQCKVKVMIVQNINDKDFMRLIYISQSKHPRQTLTFLKVIALDGLESSLEVAAAQRTHHIILNHLHLLLPLLEVNGVEGVKHVLVVEKL